MSIRIDLEKATPCAFNRGGKMKFGIRTTDKFVWITQTIDRESGINTICVSIEDPKDVTILKLGMSEKELEELGLRGFSLRTAKAWTTAD